MKLHTRWETRHGFKPAVFVYLAVLGRNWRVHATKNNGQSGEVLLRKYYTDERSARADVDRIMAQYGGLDDWHELPASKGQN